MLFSGPMVRALLAGAKTQTRRIIKPQPDMTYMGKAIPMDYEEPTYWAFGADKIPPKYLPGDRLWVKETFHYDNAAYVSKYQDAPWLGLPDAGTAETFYRASEKNPDIFPKWRPSIFMPRWASRITLEITGTGAERLKDISETDAIAEGVRTLPAPQWRPAGWRETYLQLWDDINGRDASKANPWVWVLNFKVINA